MTTISKLLTALWFVLWQPRLAPREPITDYGVREDRDGIPVVTLRGTPYQRGFQHGHQLASELRHFRQIAWQYTRRTIHARFSLPRWAAPFLAKPLLLVAGALYLPRLSADVRAEVQGLADGAGLPLRELIVNTVIWEIFALQGAHGHGVLHCSECAVDASQTAGLGPLLGYNYDVIVSDDRVVVDGFLALFVVQPTDGLAYVAPNTIGSVGLNTAMNAAGLAFGWDNSYLKGGPSGSAGGRPFMLTLRELALRAETVGEASARLEQESRPHADICVLVDHDQACAVELAGATTARRCGTVIWSCNRLQALVAHDYGGAGRAYDARHERYPQVLEAVRRPVTVAQVVAVLRDAGAIDGRQIAGPNNALSVVYAPRLQRVWVSVAGPVAAQNTMYMFDAAGRRWPDGDIGGAH